MIAGRNPRNPVIGDTVLLRADNRRGVGTIVDTDAIRYKVYWCNGRGQLSWHPRGEMAILDSITDSAGHDGSEGASAHDGNGFGGLEGNANESLHR
jgi:hypothetical protein